VAHIKRVGGLGHDVAHNAVAVDEDDFDETLRNCARGMVRTPSVPWSDVNRLGRFGEDGSGHALAVGQMKLPLFRRAGWNAQLGRWKWSGGLWRRLMPSGSTLGKARRKAPICAPRDRFSGRRGNPLRARWFFFGKGVDADASMPFRFGRLDFSFAAFRRSASAGVPRAALLESEISSLMPCAAPQPGNAGGTTGRGRFGWRVRRCVSSRLGGRTIRAKIGHLRFASKDGAKRHQGRIGRRSPVE